jgi:hypothetical protein
VDYTIGQLARLARVSVRTLRHYDRIGIVASQRTLRSWLPPLLQPGPGASATYSLLSPAWLLAAPDQSAALSASDRLPSLICSNNVP